MPVKDKENSVQGEKFKMENGSDEEEIDEEDEEEVQKREEKRKR